MYHVHYEQVVADCLQVWHLKDDLVPTLAATGDRGGEWLVIFREDFPIRPWVVSPSRPDALFCLIASSRIPPRLNAHTSQACLSCAEYEMRYPCDPYHVLQPGKYGASRQDVLLLAAVSHTMHCFCYSP